MKAAVVAVLWEIEKEEGEVECGHGGKEEEEEEEDGEDRGQNQHWPHVSSVK